LITISLAVALSFSVFPVLDADEWESQTTVEKSKIFARRIFDYQKLGPRLVVLYDYGERSEAGDRSSIYVHESNCKTGTIRSVFFRYVSGEMGQGDMVREGFNNSWQRPKKGSIAHSFWELLCETDSHIPEVILKNWDCLKSQTSPLNQSTPEGC
jgi:hypothetical protein